MSNVFPMHVGVFPARPLAVGGVFPMHVGVFLEARLPSNVSKRLPHARGGVSKIRRGAAIGNLSSPCTWGCFRRELIYGVKGAVFPMHVGVFPCKA